jgi:hypothetical protein
MFGDSVAEAFSLEIRGVTEEVGEHKRDMSDCVRLVVLTEKMS